MRNGSPQQRLEQLLATLQDLPAFEGVTFRGCGSGATFAVEGQVVVTRGLLPTSRTPLVAASDGAAALYAIWSRTGREITAFSAAQEQYEVVFLPGTMMLLADTRLLDGRKVHLVFDLGGRREVPAVPASAVEELAGLAVTHLSAPWPELVQPVLPGKFTGDIG